jgi:N-acetylneuraminic acid mutarotase
MGRPRNRRFIHPGRAALLALAGIALWASAAWAREPLDFDQRVACRQAIEEVRWQHRIWPAENASAKPPLAAVLPQDAIERDVEQTLRLSGALERFWSRPVSASDLTAELGRIFRDTRDPEQLDDLVRALDRDGYLLAECLARPLLVERLARAYFEADERLGGGDARPSFDEWLAGLDPALEHAPMTAPEDWTGWQLPELGGGAGDSWTPTAALPESTIGITAVWTGTEMIVWGGGRNTGSRYDPLTDTWTSMAMIGAPSPRRDHAAVWTGTQMVVWGGCGQSTEFCELGSGGRYNPLDDSWTPTATSPISARRFHTAVWTGTEMIVWGGCVTGSFGNNACEINLGQGGRYDPASDSWAAATGSGEPSARTRHRAVWTGDEMIVWGGYPGIGPTNTGGRYDPAANSWTATSTAGAPAPRSGHSAAWTGSEMIVWGGCDGSLCAGGTLRFGDGARYLPATNAWQAMTITGAPDPRADHTAVWSGGEMIVWGGQGQDGLSRDTGGRYDPAVNQWTPISTLNAPAPRFDHRAVWTGTEMIVWGRTDAQGRKTGGRYEPVSDSWVPTSTNDPRRPRANHVAVWTGNEMLLWGGDVGGGFAGLGDRYEPATDTWTPIADAGEPMGREHGLAAVWTGTEMIVWGGQSGTSVFNTGGRYTPLTDSWQPTTTANAPVGRSYHTMLWTGARMFVWGGTTENFETATGGLYDPAADSWTATTLTGAPLAAAYSSGAWTGARAIVWGGYGEFGDRNTGGLYDPGSNSWSPVATTGAPAARHFHTSLWTGSRMLVWGGMEGTLDNGTYLSSGALYDPVTNLWTPTTLAGAPEGRIWHSGVWSGSEAIVWGGCNGPSNCGNGLFTGARYDPASDQWTTTPLARAPGARAQHTGVWTGSALLVWGGLADAYGSYTSTGGLYVPPFGGLFADGFESGDTGAWSVTVP